MGVRARYSSQRNRPNSPPTLNGQKLCRRGKELARERSRTGEQDEPEGHEKKSRFGRAGLKSNSWVGGATADSGRTAADVTQEVLKRRARTKGQDEPEKP